MLDFTFSPFMFRDHGHSQIILLVKILLSAHVWLRDIADQPIFQKEYKALHFPIEIHIFINKVNVQ